MIDHPTIYLQPWCKDCALNDVSDTGRLWCQDDVWDECEVCQRKSVKYVIALTALTAGERGNE